MRHSRQYWDYADPVSELDAEPPPSTSQGVIRSLTLRRPPDSRGFGFILRGDRDQLGGGVYVAKIEPGSAADQAGIRPGDQILTINGTSFESVSHTEAIRTLKSVYSVHMTINCTGRLAGNGGGGPKYQWVDRAGRSVSPPSGLSSRYSGGPFTSYVTSSPSRVPTAAANLQRSNSILGVSGLTSLSRPLLSRVMRSNPDPAMFDGTAAPAQELNRKVTISLSEDESLGLMIRGGTEYGLGIYITGIDPDSPAEKADLKIGDQILEVNGLNFEDITHDEAVRVLKHTKHLVMKIRDVGKIPYVCTTYDELHWMDSSRLCPGENCENHEPPPYLTADPQSLKILNEKARLVMNRREQATLNYYRAEYERGQMTLDSFVAVLLELLNSADKFSLLAEIREVIPIKDRVKFDDLIYSREWELKQTCQKLGSSLEHLAPERMVGCPGRSRSGPESFRSSSAERSKRNHGDNHLASHHHSDPYETKKGVRCICEDCMTAPSGAKHHFHANGSIVGLYSEIDELHTPSEDSGVDVANGQWKHRQSSIWDVAKIQEAEGRRVRWEAKQNGSGGGGGGVGGGGDEADSGWGISGIGIPDGPVPSVGPAAPTPSATNSPRRTSGSSDCTDALGIVMPLHEEEIPGDYETTSCRTTIMIKKSKATLGIALEGGCDTKHPLPRIINIHPHGAAADAGGLKVGHVILEVDGRKMKSLNHGEAAALVAERYTDSTRPELELTVTEVRKPTLEMRRSAKSFKMVEQKCFKML